MAQRTGFSDQTKVTIGVFGVIILLLVALVTWEVSRTASTSSAADSRAAVVRANSHVLQQGRPGSPVLVEFLDFECEACGALYPTMEETRAKYPDDLTVVARYFPLDGHANARNAAHAVEAASRQGEFEAMYDRMYETQTSWAEAQVDRSSVFRGFAEDLGLDLDRFDRDVASAAVARRVDQDYQEARRLGLSGTPSLFLDGSRLELTDAPSFEKAIAEAVGRTT